MGCLFGSISPFMGLPPQLRSAIVGTGWAGARHAMPTVRMRLPCIRIDLIAVRGNTAQERGTTMESTDISRRNFVSGAVAAGLAMTAASTAKADNASGDGTDIAWDEECDVLVVGSGYSGLAAALEAHAAGADVKIIDKRASFGGNSLIADGDFAVCGSSAQAAQGVEDSVDDYVNDMLVAGLNLNDVEKCRQIAELSNETWEWTREYLGVEFVTLEDGNIELLPYGGHSNYRTMKPVGAGAAYVLALKDKVDEAGMEIETGTMLATLITNADGRVVGAKVGVGVTDDTDASTGEPRTIKARKAVVLATGGFGGDVAWRQLHDPTLDETVASTNREGTTAEALQAAMRIGALPVHLDWIQLGPWCSPDETDCGAAWTYIDSAFPYGPCIDPTTCKRIVSELNDRKRLCDAIIANGQPLIQIVDERNLPDWAFPYLETCLDYPCTWKFDSLEEIAEQFGLDFDAMKAEIDRYNSFVESGVDEDFGKAIPETALPMAEPPFYVTRVWPKVHHTMGGLKTNLDSQVLDVELNVIPGLYAAGEATGGIHGACRLGSCATADCLINGRIAGQKAAAEEDWQ